MSGLPAPGDLVRHYRIVRLIMHGGVGATFEVEDTRTSQRFAMKRLSLVQLRDWKEYELFEREARVLASLRHPCIPRYVEHFELEQPRGEHAYYLVQELAPGASLAQRVRAGWRCDEAGVRRIAFQVLDILRDLQSLAPPVFHRDVKPQNLLLADDGRVFLVDFGAVQDAYRNLTGGSTVVGTYGYMAPEQLRGVALPATDVYGVASTVLFLLTGVSPSELPQKGLRPDFRSRVRCSPALADWLDRALEPEPEKRFAGAHEALSALRGAPVAQTKKKTAARTWVLAGALLAVLIPGAALVAVFEHRSTSRADARPLATSRLDVLPPRPASDRSVVVEYPIHVIKAHHGGSFSVDVSPDGSMIASGGGDGAVKLWNASTGDAVATLGGYKGRVYGTRFSRDGRLVTSGAQRVDVWDVRARKSLVSIDADPQMVGGVDPSPDGRYVATAGQKERAVKLWDMSTGAAVRTFEPAPGKMAIALAFSPDGKTIAAAGNEPIIRLWNVDTGALLATIAGHRATVDKLAFSPDGQALFSVSDDRTLREWSLDGQPRVVVADFGNEVWSMALSPRGDLLATGTKDGFIKVWDVTTLALKYQWQDGSQGTPDVAFFPDGTRVAAAQYNSLVNVWAVPSHTHASVPVPPALEPPHLAGSPTPAEACARASALVDEAMGRDVLGEAEALARGALAKDGRYVPAYCALARAALRRGYLSGHKYTPEAIDTATKLVDRAALIDSSSPDVHLARAWVLHASEDHDAAARQAHLSEANGPTAAADTLLAVDASLSEAAYQDAERYALRALSEKPTRGQAVLAYQALETTYEDDGDYEAAREAYRAQIDVYPDSPWPKGNFARFLVVIGDYPGAADAARRALAQMDYPMARTVLSESQSEAGIVFLWDRDHSQEARTSFEAAIAADPSNGTAHYGLGAYWRQLAVAKKDPAALARSREELEKSAAAGNALAKAAVEENAAVAALIEPAR